jgi:uncharacterized protein (TIGR03000 family)
MPEAIRPAPRPSGEEEEVMAPTSASIIVTMPADATLTFDGNPTTSRDAVRTFVTPPLQPNRTFSYTLKADGMRDGQPVSTTQRVEVRAGKETRVNLDLAAANPLPRPNQNTR